MNEIEKLITTADNDCEKAKKAAKKYIDMNDFDKAMSKLLLASIYQREWHLVYRLKGMGLFKPEKEDKK